MRYKAIKTRDNKDKTVGIFENRDDAVNALIDEVRGSYCLDGDEERRSTLEMQNYYVIGCGPDMLIIEEVE